MPTYNYECRVCNRTWEAFHSISDRNSETCEQCAHPANIVLGVPQIASFSLKSPEEKTAALKKRSVDHTRSEIKKHGVPQRDRKTKSYR